MESSLMSMITKLLQISTFIYKIKITQKMKDYKNSLINFKAAIFNLKITNIKKYPLLQKIYLNIQDY